MFCGECGNQIRDDAAFCVKCGVATGAAPVRAVGQVAVANLKSRLTFIVLGVFLGNFGVHNFYAGYTGRAVAQLLVTLMAQLLTTLRNRSLILPVMAVWVPLITVWMWVIVEVCTVKNDAQGRPTTTSMRGVGQDRATRWVLPVGRSGYAIAAGYLGLFSLLVVPAPLALLFGILAVNDLKKNPTRHGILRRIIQQIGMTTSLAQTAFPERHAVSC